MAYVFRFHEGNNLKGWQDSSALNEAAIKAIKDPNGADASREITSIPSPFARIDLVRTAFKEVANTDLTGETIFHKMVSDALDIGQILFNAEKYSNEIEIISWDKKTDLEILTKSTLPEHRLLGESLRLFLQQDSETYNFNLLSKVYLINYKNGPDELNIIGGTSPATLFFTSANKYKLEGFQEGNDKLLDDEFRGLHQRDDEFIKYLFSLRATIPGFSTKMAALDDYFVAVFRELSADLKQEISNIAGYYDTLPNLSLNGGGELIEVLGTPLKRAKGLVEKIKTSDFVIDSEKSIGEENPPLVLPNDSFNIPLTYVSALWDSKIRAPHFDPRELKERTLPSDGNTYPYLTISDFLEPVIIRTESSMDTTYFETCGHYEEKGYLLPIKPLFFKYFSVNALKGTVNGEKCFELNSLTNGYIEAILRIPVQGGQAITFRRTYNNPVNMAHRPEVGLSNNKGAIIENRINLGISPFYKFPDGINTEYTVALYDADFLPIFEKNRYELNFYDSSNSLISNVTSVQRHYKEERLFDMDAYLVKSNFEFIQLKHNFASGILIPNFESRIGGTSKYAFSIDFGTTNTHIEYTVDSGTPQPFELEKREKFHFGSLIRLKELNEGYLKALREDIFPEEILAKGNYSFPQRTAITYHKKTNFQRAVFSLGNISIPFKYEKESFDLFSKVLTNLKWNSSTPERQIIVFSFFEQLAKMIRNKVLLNNGDLRTVEIIWSYPASMQKYQRDQLEKGWQEIIHHLMGNPVKIFSVPESLTPFYYFAKYVGIDAMEKPLVSIDIGGGTSDVAVYKEKEPVLFTSYKFAGDAIFGDNYNRNININGFVNKYFPMIIQKLNENDQKVLIEALENIRKNNLSHDVINAFFSLKDNKILKEKNIDVDFLRFLSTDSEFKIVFLLFFVSQTYHIAQLLKKEGIAVPGVIMFSGTASKLLGILDKSSHQRNLKRLAQESFKEVYGLDELPEMQIKLPENPKEISSKGGLSVPNPDQLNLDKIKSTLITTDNLQGKEVKITYEHIKAYEGRAIKDFDGFLDFFFGLHNSYSYRENFGLEKSVLDYTQAFLQKKKVNAMKTGIQNKLEEMNDRTEEVNETLFFYPLIGTLAELTYELEKKNKMYEVV